MKLQTVVVTAILVAFIIREERRINFVEEILEDVTDALYTYLDRVYQEEVDEVFEEMIEEFDD